MENLDSKSQVFKHSLMRSVLMFALVLWGTFAFSQTYHTQDKKAIKYYDEAYQALNFNDFELAEIQFEKALARDADFLEAKYDLAQLFLFTKRSERAVTLLEEIEKKDIAFDISVSHTLGKLAQSEGDYDKASVHFNNVLKVGTPKQGMLSSARLGAASCSFAKNAIQNPVEFNPVNLGEAVNSATDEYFPALTADEETLLFTRLLESARSADGYDEDFYFCEWNGEGWGKAYNPGRPINSPLKEGAPTLSPDGKYIIFTACESYGNYGEGKKGYGSCDLFVSERHGKSWSRPRNMGRTINSPHWETQPSFASDGKTLYFIRGKRTQKGVNNSDIYVSELTSSGWSKAVPLPSNINSPESEESVFIHPDNQTLYFSSRGHVGMGDMDIYMSKKKRDGAWTDPVNLGYPINTHGQENSFHVSASGEYGLIASDREGGYGGLDLYSFELPEHIRPEKTTYLKGKITDAKTGKPLKAKFELINLETGDTVVQSYSDETNGRYLVVLPSSKEYALAADKTSYLFHSENFKLDSEENQTHFIKNIELQPIEAGSRVVLKNVFFDTDKFELKPASKQELDRLAKLLRANTSMRIEIGGHTDNQGNPSSNQVLSENRAKAVYSYLVNTGQVPMDQMTFKGYGQDSPIASNDTEEGRAQNRRTEFLVLD